MCTSFKGAQKKQKDQPQDASHASSMCFAAHGKKKYRLHYLLTNFNKISFGSFIMTQ